jgi:carboxyl-terminal processing protease
VRARFISFLLTVAVMSFMAGSLFLLGYAVGRTQDSQVDRALASTLQSLGLGRYATIVERPPSGANDLPLTEEERKRLNVLWEAWGWVEKEFYNRQAIDHQKMIYGAVRGMLSTLGDPHTVFLDPVAQRISDAEFRGAFEGIGVHVDLRDGQLQVVSPIEGSPGDRAGLKPGDVITHVDGKDIRGMALMDAVLLIRGPRGTGVTLTVKRQGVEDPLDFAIVREEIKIRSVRGEMREDGLANLRINSFQENTGPDVVSTLQELVKHRPRGLILDLRNNPGGYLHTSIEVASQFLQEGVVVYQEEAGGARKTHAVKPGGLATSLPIAVLVNRGSASASEIVAAALRDHGRAVLIGEQTFGKGTVQNIHHLSDSSSLRVTFARWVSPREHPLEGTGLRPDVEVPTHQPGEDDRQLQAAARYLHEHSP